ncbi:MAG: nitroreductase, partial [Anaerolineae bacterium]
MSVLASALLLAILRLNPRLMLQDYPEEFQNQIPPKTDKEKRQSLIVGIPFLLLLVAVPFISTLMLKRQGGGAVSFLPLFLNAFGVVFIFNLVDLLLLDWLVFCYITPDFLVIPGTEGMREYKDYGYHFRGFLTGTLLSVVAGLV